MRPGDLIYPRAIHRDLPKDVHFGFYTGETDQFNRKIILWSTGRTTYLEPWEEKYYEVISEAG